MPSTNRTRVPPTSVVAGPTAPEVDGPLGGHATEVADVGVDIGAAVGAAGDITYAADPEDDVASSKNNRTAGFRARTPLRLCASRPSHVPGALFRWCP